MFIKLWFLVVGNFKGEMNIFCYFLLMCLNISKNLIGDSVEDDYFRELKIMVWFVVLILMYRFC